MDKLDEGAQGVFVRFFQQSMHKFIQNFKGATNNGFGFHLQNQSASIGVHRRFSFFWCGELHGWFVLQSVSSRME